MCITCTDVVARKFGIPIPLTKFQELEWYMHTALFSMWMGYNYTINAHPRVDSYTETLPFRSQGLDRVLRAACCSRCPTAGCCVRHGWDFFWTSYLQNESSENAVGLEHRWIIKGVFYGGLWLLLAGVLSVMLRLIVVPVRRRTAGRRSSCRSGTPSSRSRAPMLDWIADNLALIMFVADVLRHLLRLPGRLRDGRHRPHLRLHRLAARRVPDRSLSNILLRMWGGVAVDPVLVSIPMFIFMGSILERSGSAKDMLLATEILLKRVPGGLAVAVMVMGTILAAPIGVVGAAVVLLSVIALPQMLAAGYDKRLGVGTIASAGTLGILIPPAIMLVVMAEMLNTSAGALFAAATMPGLPAVGALSRLHPRRRADQTRVGAEAARRTTGRRPAREFWHTMWKGLFPMTFLMVVVLGAIFAGWATATESAGVGVLGSFVIARAQRPPHAAHGQRLRSARPAGRTPWCS